MSVPCTYIEYWPENGSLEPIHLAKICIIDYILVCLE